MLDPEMTKAEIQRLYRLLYERDKEFERAKLVRILLTTAGFAAVIFIVLWKISKDRTLEDALWLIVASIILASIHVLINASVFGSLFRKGREESEHLAAIRKHIEELEKTLPR